MKENIINFFLKRHLLANLIFVTVFVGGIIAWNQIPKEELPDVTFDNVRISVSYPGASAEEVEYYVTRPIEEAVRSLDGIYRITSSTGVGTCRVTAEIEKSYPNKDEVIADIRNAVLDVDLPVDVNKVGLQVAVKEEGVITLQNTYNEYLNMIIESIRYEDEKELQPDIPSAYEGTIIDFKKDYAIFNTESRTSRILKMLEDKSSLEVDKYADELFPSIDLIAGYSLDGSGHDIKDSDQRVFAGVSVEWPLPGAVERANYETSKIDQRKSTLSSENIHLRLRTNLKNLNDQITKENELIVIAQEKISFAESILADEKENYSLGRTTLNDFIDEVNRLEENKFNKIFHEVQLKRLIVEWLRLTDSLVIEKGGT